MVYELLLWIIILEKTDEVVLKYKYIICESFYLPEEVLRSIVPDLPKNGFTSNMIYISN